jgi:glycosyltransferase involved in cell wall biosynthesis
MSNVELSVVIPVYNEEEIIETVIASWSDELDEIGIDYEFLVYNDGSKDGTWKRLENLMGRLPRLAAINKTNEGHGPTILRGYREARGQWVFQTDGDDEMPPKFFKDLWAARHDYDILLGIRKDRKSPYARRIITLVANTVAALLWGPGTKDVNTPYRLMRKTALDKLLNYLPADTFAPNIIISGLSRAEKLRIYQSPVSYSSRKTGVFPSSDGDF